jgi:hypothetical protein
MKFDPHIRMISRPFTDQPLRGRITAMSVHDQDALESLLSHVVENIAQDRKVGLHPQCDRSRKRAKIRRDAVSEHRKNRHAEWLRCFGSEPFRQNAIHAQAEIRMLLRASEWQDTAIVPREVFLHHHPIHLGDAHRSNLSRNFLESSRSRDVAPQQYS